MVDRWLTMSHSPAGSKGGAIPSAIHNGLKPLRAFLGHLLHTPNRGSGEDGVINPIEQVQSPSPEMSRIPSGSDAITLAPRYESRISSWQPPESINTGEGTTSDVPPSYRTD